MDEKVYVSDLLKEMSKQAKESWPIIIYVKLKNFKQQYY